MSGSGSSTGDYFNCTPTHGATATMLCQPNKNSEIFLTRAWVGRHLVHALLTALPAVSAVQDRKSKWVCK